MKSILIGVLMEAVMLVMISSCATVPTESLGPGEVRLLNIDFPDYSEVKKNLRIDIKFETEGSPEITRVCLQWSGYGVNCVKALDYGNGLLRADVLAPEIPASYAVKAYVYYVRNGKVEQSNIVETPVEVKGEKKQRR